MIKSLLDLFEQKIKPELRETKPAVVEHAVREATAALLVEMAKADFSFDIQERLALEKILRDVYQLSADEVEALVALAEQEVDGSISLDQFTKLLDRNLKPDQKSYVLELLWRLAFADGRVDRYEEYLLRKISDLLHLPHKEFIRTKLKVAQESQVRIP